MFKCFSLFVLLLLPYYVIAQQLTFDTPEPLFPYPKDIPKIEAFNGTSKFCDIDNDGDLDLITSGKEGFNERTSIYKNDGTGVLSIFQSFPFGPRSAVILPFNIDNDNDTDFIIYGGNYSTSLFKNNGTGHFFQSPLPFQVSYLGAVINCDIDNDGDQDLIVSGTKINDTLTLAVYTNNGSGELTYSDSRGIKYLHGMAVDCGDIDGDNDQDLIVSGTASYPIRETTVYLNDSLGGFSKDSLNILPGGYSGTIRLFDSDNDSDLDLITTATYEKPGYSSTNRTDYYKNDGTGKFILQSHTFQNISSGNISIIDIDNDSDLDIALSGHIQGVNSSPLIVYRNNGNGTFNAMLSTSYSGIEFSTGDINNDSFPDFFQHSQGLFSPPSLLLNKNGLDFEYINGGPFKYLSGARNAIGDFNNNGEQDYFIRGIYNQSASGKSFIYLNNQNNSFTEKESNIIAENLGTVQAEDIDDDGDLDILSAGRLNHSNLYLNDGVGNFQLKKMIGSSTFGLAFGSFIKLVDIDNDGDLDYYSSQPQEINGSQTFFYKNDGAANFTALPQNQITSLYFGSSDFGDFDNDGDEDLICYGVNYEPSTRLHDTLTFLYLNDGKGNFTDSKIEFEAFYHGNVKWVDLNHDGFLDLFINAFEAINQTLICKQYTNNQHGGFTIANNYPFVPMRNGTIDVEDLNNDKIPEIIRTGSIDDSTGLSYPITKVYTFNGTDNYVSILDNYFESVSYASLAFGDINNDGKKDIAITGSTSANTLIPYDYIPLHNSSEIYINTSSIQTVSFEKQTSCGNFNWNSTGNNYTQSGVYYDTLFNSNQHGLDSIVCLDLQIINFESNLSLNLDTLLYLSSKFDSIQWISCDSSRVLSTSSINYFLPTVQGNYAAIVSNGNCIETTNCLYFAITSSLIINPNPSFDHISVSNFNIINNKPLRIYSINGVLKKEVKNYIKGQEIDIRSLNQGMYTIIYQDKESKFIKL